MLFPSSNLHFFFFSIFMSISSASLTSLLNVYMPSRVFAWAKQGHAFVVSKLMQGKQSLSRMGKKVSSFLSSSIFTLRLRNKCSHAAINVWSSNAATKTWISRVWMDVSGALTDTAAAWKTNLQATLKNFSAESWQSFLLREKSKVQGFTSVQCLAL